MTPVLVDKRYSLDQSDLGREPWGAPLECVTSERIALATRSSEKCDALVDKKYFAMYLSIKATLQGPELCVKLFLLLRL